ncbi:hypothetical protein BGX31_005331 [Mortierella sp. GBA43]|nr:hypothetical protein BGX31_005331 [Mortierella sp. GBA43]
MGSFSDAPPVPRARKVREDSSDEADIGYVPHNRGNKLKRRPNIVTGGTRLVVPDLNGSLQDHSSNSHSGSSNGGGTHGLIDETEEHQIRSNFRNSLAAAAAAAAAASTTSTSNNTNSTGRSLPGSLVHPKREVIQVRPVAGPGSMDDVEGGEEALSDDENPYAGIKIGEILSPLESSTEILHRPQLRKLFHSPQLQIMAVHAMAMIEREKMVNKMMSRVALILQGDDPLYPQLGYGMGEGCSTALMGMPDQEELIDRNKEWKKSGEDQEQVQKTLGLLMENISCSNQYIDLLNESRDAVNHVSKQKKQLWKKLKEKRARARARMQPRNSRVH